MLDNKQTELFKAHTIPWTGSTQIKAPINLISKKHTPVMSGIDTLPNDTPLSTTPEPEFDQNVPETKRCQRLQEDLSYANARLHSYKAESERSECLERYSENLRKFLAQIEEYATNTFKTCSKGYTTKVAQLYTEIAKHEIENSKLQLDTVNLREENERLQIEADGLEGMNNRYAEHIESLRGLTEMYESERHPNQFVQGVQADAILPQYNGNSIQTVTYEPPTHNPSSFIINPDSPHPQENVDYGIGPAADSSETYPVTATQVTEPTNVPVQSLLAPMFPISAERNSPWPICTDDNGGNKRSQGDEGAKPSKKRKSK
ncbi:hypothetical protein V502_02129 [Pseudogymnoascus sp. VKM F-4520 (FW-2644)]|nr:hypothetical protein V502_02129 [Pseudogymnoascus sp. VKM F-4520 (FW-2644)]